MYAAIAFANSRENPDPDIFQMAKRVEGWGRIHCVERLSKTTDPEIKNWILRDGFRNRVMNEYLAYIGATTGGLLDALKQPNPDRELLTAAGEIFSALFSGGPAETLDDYDQAPTALRLWLEHMATKAELVSDLLAISAANWFLKHEHSRWEKRFERGWTSQDRSELQTISAELLERPEWRAIIDQDLASDDWLKFHQATFAARGLGYDIFDVLIRKLESKPVDGPWYQAWLLADDSRAPLLAELAERLLDLDTIATGATDVTGIGPGFEKHEALRWTLQGLKDYPGVGSKLVTTGMQSPSNMDRRAAIRVLSKWGQESWAPEHQTLLTTISEQDPADKVRAAAVKLRGQ